MNRRTLAIVVAVVLCVVGLLMSCVALTVLIPDHVIAALNALPPREDVHPDYFFWSGNSMKISLTPIARHLCCHSASEWHQHAGFVQDAGAQIGKDYGEVLFVVGS